MDEHTCTRTHHMNTHTRKQTRLNINVLVCWNKLLIIINVIIPIIIIVTISHVQNDRHHLSHNHSTNIITTASKLIPITDSIITAS